VRSMLTYGLKIWSQTKKIGTKIFNVQILQIQDKDNDENMWFYL